MIGGALAQRSELRDEVVDRIDAGVKLGNGVGGSRDLSLAQCHQVICSLAGQTASGSNLLHQLQVVNELGGVDAENGVDEIGHVGTLLERCRQDTLEPGARVEREVPAQLLELVRSQPQLVGLVLTRERKRVTAIGVEAERCTGRERNLEADIAVEISAKLFEPGVVVPGLNADIDLERTIEFSDDPGARRKLIRAGNLTRQPPPGKGIG